MFRPDTRILISSSGRPLSDLSSTPESVLGLLFDLDLILGLAINDGDLDAGSNAMVPLTAG